MDQIRGLFHGLRLLSLAILIMLTLYLLLDDAGMLEEFEQTLTSQQSKVITQEIVLADYATEKVKVYNISFLKDPATKENNVYRGAMKKEALDRMTLLQTETFEIVEKDNDSGFSEVTNRAAKLGANTIIIDNEMTLFRSKGGFKK